MLLPPFHSGTRIEPLEDFDPIEDFDVTGGGDVCYARPDILTPRFDRIDGYVRISVHIRTYP